MASLAHNRKPTAEMTPEGIIISPLKAIPKSAYSANEYAVSRPVKKPFNATTIGVTTEPTTEVPQKKQTNWNGINDQKTESNTLKKPVFSRRDKKAENQFSPKSLIGSELLYSKHPQRIPIAKIPVKKSRTLFRPRKSIILTFLTLNTLDLFNFFLLLYKTSYK